MGRVFVAYRNHPHYLKLFGKALNQGTLGRWLGLTQAQVSKIEHSSRPEIRLDVLTNWAKVLQLPSDMLWFDMPDQRRLGGNPGQDGAESLRQQLHDVLSNGAMADVSLDDWDLTVIRYGRATRDRPAGALLHDLTVDLTELKKTIERHRSASALRRLTRVAAHMSGLMCLTLCKLDDRGAFHRWARTARSAANEAGDVLVLSWILAQEAYGHYYSGDLPEAVEVARYAQKIVPMTPCVGSALAAALEARAHALMSRHRETREALARAEQILSCLKGEELASSAFGYNEAQLRFHEGNAYTHLRDMAAATKAQDRALQLCAPGDYTDWSMVRLDRASCLARSGDAVDAIPYAMETLAKLTEPQRRGIITVRAREIIDDLPTAQRTLPPVRELHDMLMISA